MKFQNISKVEYIDDPVDYHDMVVNDTHNFCLANGLVVHNCGVGFSVQKHHIDKLPTIARRSSKKAKIFRVPDSIEGWADSFAVLLSSYFTSDGVFPEYNGCQVHFDFSKIRPKGSKISGGFKAPGPDGLRQSLVKCEDLLENLLKDSPITKINSITAYDFVMHLSDAVLSGGVRRSATICLFDKDDNDMLNSKTGDWFINNPQRGRSNNSAIIMRDELVRDEWSNIMKSVKDYGEPGFVFSDNKEFIYNPCHTGDTLITVKDHDTTVNGKENSSGVVYQIPLKQLVKLKQSSDLCPMVLSYNTTTNLLEFSDISNGALTRENAKVLKLTFSNGKTVKCTPDHKIYTKNRSYVNADKLTVDDIIVFHDNAKTINCYLENRESIENEDVYDITVPGNSNFFAEGILVHNCCEIGMMPTLNDESGFQFCNLTEINGSKCVDIPTFHRACKAASILGTIQAGYTNFKYLSEVSKKITEKEALIGVSITGWMNNPEILFDKSNMISGSNIVKETNKEIANLIGINQAARTTTTKPSGNASILLGTASGIHGEHAPMYFRNVQMNKNDIISDLICEINPDMVEKSVWSANGTDIVVSFPIETKPGSVYKSDLMGVKQLEYVKLAQQYWVENGTNIELCSDSRLRHNVSNTITVDDWNEVEQYLFDNRQWFAGVSLLSAQGDKAYMQAPFTEVLTSTDIFNKYGDGSLFASGLIVDALHAFNENLWLACDTVLGKGLKLSDDSIDLLKRDLVRRAVKFAENYFNNDLITMTHCLKDCYNLHKWAVIKRNLKPIDFSKQLSKQTFIEVDTLSSQGCSGGGCEITF